MIYEVMVDKPEIKYMENWTDLHLPSKLILAYRCSIYVYIVPDWVEYRKAVHQLHCWMILHIWCPHHYQWNDYNRISMIPTSLNLTTLVMYVKTAFVPWWCRRISSSDDLNMSVKKKCDKVHFWYIYIYL